MIIDVIGEIHGPWTFATRESTENGATDARLLFLTRDPEFSAHSGRRVQIRQEDQADGRYADFARTLVDAYRRGGADVISRVRGLRTEADIAGWAKAALLAPGVLADHWWLLTSALTGEMSPVEQGFLDSPQGRRFIAGALGRSSEAEIIALLSNADPGSAAAPRRPADGAVLDEALRRCLAGHWPTAELLAAVRRAQPAERQISATLARGLPDTEANWTRQNRQERRMIAIAVALTLCGGLLRADESVRRAVARVPASDLLSWARTIQPMRAPFIRMLADTAADRRRPDPAVRAQLETARYFADTVVAAYEATESVTAMADLLELGYGVGIARTPDEALAILRRLGGADIDLVHIVLMALGLRVREANARSLVEHTVALREFRRYQPDFRPPDGPSGGAGTAAAPRTYIPQPPQTPAQPPATIPPAIPAGSVGLVGSAPSAGPGPGASGSEPPGAHRAAVARRWRADPRVWAAVTIGVLLIGAIAYLVYVIMNRVG